MFRSVVRLLVLLTIVCQSAGCALINLGPWGGPAYTLDLGKIGTSDQAIAPRNDASFSSGEPMDYRARR